MAEIFQILLIRYCSHCCIFSGWNLTLILLKFKTISLGTIEAKTKDFIDMCLGSLLIQKFLRCFYTYSILLVSPLKKIHNGTSQMTKFMTTFNIVFI